MIKYFFGFLPVASVLILGTIQFSALSQDTDLTIKTMQGTQGEYLTDYQGMSLYVFASDTPGPGPTRGGYR